MADRLVAERSRARIGQVLCDKWTIDGLLGVGAMAAVYSATHRNGRRVAIKILHPVIAADPDKKARFLREGYASNKVQHPGCVAVLDDDTTERGEAFLVMELLEGETLKERAQSRGPKLPVVEVVSIADQLLDVLVAAHEKGIIHRDIKPENLFLTREGILKVCDFGLARMDEQNVNTTATGEVLGTPGFMPPEQASAKWNLVDGRTDLWSSGATLFMLLTGRLVYPGDSVAEVLVQIMTKAAPPIASIRADIPPALAAVIDRALVSDMADRWPDARSMQAALREATRPWQAPPPVVTYPAGLPFDGSSSMSSVVHGGPVAVGTTLTASVQSQMLRAAPRKRWALPAIAAGSLLLGGGAVIALLAGGPDAQPTVIEQGAPPTAMPPPSGAVIVEPAAPSGVPAGSAAASAAPSPSVSSSSGPSAKASARPPRPPPRPGQPATKPPGDKLNQFN